MEKKFKMVALDLDGTLLNSKHEISETSIAHLRYLHNKGFIICIATGRSAYAASQIIYQLDLDYSTFTGLSTGIGATIAGGTGVGDGGFPLVCTNGANGMSLKRNSSITNSNSDSNSDSNSNSNSDSNSNPITDGRFETMQLFHKPVPLDITKKALKLAESFGCVTNYYINHDVYAQPTTEWHHNATSKYTQLTGVKYTFCDDDYETAMEEGLPSKLLILCPPIEIDDLYHLAKEEFGNDAKVIRGTPPFFVEILHKDVCKGNGLRQMCDTLYIRLDECIAFGDGDNDLEFLKFAGLGIAMKNAVQVLKDVADDVTEYCNDDDGVVHALQKLEQSGKLHFQT